MLRYSLKSSLLLSRLPNDPVLFPDRGTATGFWRGRIEPTFRAGEGVTFDVAFEQRLRVFSSTSRVAGADVLPSEAPAPFRMRQLDWNFASSSRTEWRGELDRAALHVHLAGADVTLGRQAVGWGRGVLFGAVDLFAPFTPLEADREWRRGVDAARADVRFGHRVFQERYLRGDTQILGRHAAAVLSSYEYGPELTLTGQWLQSPADGSGVVVGSTGWTFSDGWSAVVSAYLPYGREPIGPTLHSEFWRVTNRCVRPDQTVSMTRTRL